MNSAPLYLYHRTRKQCQQTLCCMFDHDKSSIAMVLCVKMVTRLKTCNDIHAVLPVCMVPSGLLKCRNNTSTISMSTSCTCYVCLDMSGVQVVDS